MSNFWKAAVVILVIVIAAIIIVPKMIGTTSNTGTTVKSDGSSLALIEKTVKNGKPTLLFLRSST